MQQDTRSLRRPRAVDTVFLTRAHRALEGLTRELSKDALSVAAAAPSDLEVVLRALLAAPSLVARATGDRLAPARLRGQQAQLGILDREGGTLSATEIAKRLGVSRQAVNKRRQAGRLLALPVGRRRFAYPLWQLAGTGALPGFEKVLAALDEHDPWMQARFFLGRNARLGDARPLDALRNGDVEAVTRAAAEYGRHGAV